MNTAAIPYPHCTSSNKDSEKTKQQKQRTEKQQHTQKSQNNNNQTKQSGHARTHARTHAHTHTHTHTHRAQKLVGTVADSRYHNIPGATSMLYRLDWRTLEQRRVG